MPTTIPKATPKSRKTNNHRASKPSPQQMAVATLEPETAPTSDYQAFLASKRIIAQPAGFAIIDEAIHTALFNWQRQIVRWAVQRGRAAIFADTGLGKTVMQLEWARQVARQTGGNVLILAPLAVAQQTAREASEKLDFEITVCRTQADVAPGVNITNYERLHHFKPGAFVGIVLDESSILKAFDGKTRRALTAFARNILYRLACTATPAPNDLPEIANHAEFLDILSGKEIMALFFTQDGNTTRAWRLKGHARADFWRWLAAWAVALRKPSDIGFPDGDFRLPPLTIEQHEVAGQRLPGHLFTVEANTLPERRKARQSSLSERVMRCAELVNASPDSECWLIWCDLNAESRALVKAIPGAVEVTGSDTPEWKTQAAQWFVGEICECRLNKSAKHITGRGWNKTESMSESIGEPQPSVENPVDGNSTPAILSGGQRQSNTLRSGDRRIQKATSRNVSGSSALPLTNIGESSQSRVADVPFVDLMSQETSPNGSTLTTTTQQDVLEASSVLPATSESANSTMIQNGLNAPQCTCGGVKSKRVIVSKPSIFGFGLNFQVCHNVAFVGLSDSWEQFYQATRRCWRYGQQHPVVVHVITSEIEGAVVANIQRKERDANALMDSLVAEVAKTGLSGARGARGVTTSAVREEVAYQEGLAEGRDWTLYQGDSVLLMDAIESESVGLSIFSPPFPGMYAYTNSPHDMGNTRSIEEMLAQFRYLVGRDKLLRVTMPGRMCCIHLTQSPAFKHADGYIGLKDFRGEVIKLMSDAGWVYYGEVTIDKDPQVKAQRTKERGLMFRTLATDSSLMRMALADYLIYFMKPGDNPRPIRAGKSEKYHNPDGWITNDEWIEWAHPIWRGVRETNVLNVRQARETDDERHLCPLQLDVIERAIKLWSAPGDLVFDPFTGIGSVGEEALRLGRRFVGCELKESYWRSACANLHESERKATAATLWSLLDAPDTSETPVVEAGVSA